MKLHGIPNVTAKQYIIRLVGSSCRPQHVLFKGILFFGRVALD